jgi:glycosyltransferase involved in cell wall biosynthesis
VKITIVQGPFYPVPPLLGGAIEKAWFDLGREFAARGHQVTHISRRFEVLPPSQHIDGVQHLRLPSRNALRSRIPHRLFDLMYSARALKVMPAADIVITNSVWLPILIRDSRYGALYGHVGRYPKQQMWLYSHTARLQTVSKAAAEAIARQTPRCAGQVRLIPYPVARAGACDTEKDYWSGREKMFLYAGRIRPEKGLEILLNAFARFASSDASLDKDRWRLVLIGPWQTSAGGGGARFYQRLREIAADGRPGRMARTCIRPRFA